MKLEEYTYHIEHRPGSENRLPDYLSRVPDLEYDREVQNESIFEDKVFVTETALSEPNLVLEQKRDPEISDALGQLDNTGEVSSGKFRGVSEQLRVEKEHSISRVASWSQREQRIECRRGSFRGPFRSKNTTEFKTQLFLAGNG